MKQLLFVMILCCIVSPILASKIAVLDTSTSPVIYKPTIVAIPNNSTIKQLLGRKLTLKEKLGLLFVRAKYKKGIPVDTLEAQNANSNAVFGFVLSMLGLFFFPFLIPGYILSNNVLNLEKKKPGLLTNTNKTLAEIGKVTAIVWGILIVLFLFVIIALVSHLK